MELSDISLSNSKDTSKVSYTKEELNLASQIATACMAGIGVIDADDVEVDDAIVELLQEEAQNHSKAGPLCRAVYRLIERSKFEVVDDETLRALEPSNFPKPRDYTSITLLFRKALKGVVEKGVIDQVFPHKTYTPKKRKIV